jgi:hypothetical protein
MSLAACPNTNVPILCYSVILIYNKCVQEYKPICNTFQHIFFSLPYIALTTKHWERGVYGNWRTDKQTDTRVKSRTPSDVFFLLKFSLGKEHMQYTAPLHQPQRSDNVYMQETVWSIRELGLLLPQTGYCILHSQLIPSSAPAWDRSIHVKDWKYGFKQRVLNDL